jgi:ubiquinone/menaquinone biosynthesis C-methylase UbiE
VQQSLQDYITEITYISNYYGDLTPKHLVFVAAINNFPHPDIGRPFAYCELGCGCGKTVNTVAAAYPNSNCFGVDINQEHIKIARNESFGLSNITFLDMPFEKALVQSLPRFDFIVLHGVWSWVSDAVRRDVCKFVRKFLKTNGLFYISYDSMPGWAQLLPFHKIMSLYTRNMHCSVEEKARSAMAYLQYLNCNRSPFFERNPDAEKFLQMLEQSDIRYIVHELFNCNLRPEYFCDVAAELRKAGLTFVGDNNYINNYDMTLPEPFRQLLATADDRISMETHKSIIQNDRFRKDVYAKRSGKTPLPEEMKKWLETFLFGASQSPEELRLNVDFQWYSINLAPEPYLRIFEILSGDQMTIQELNRKLGRSADALAQTLENMINCMLSHQFAIFLTKTPVGEVGEKITFTCEYNRRQITNWRDQYSRHVYLASPVTGDAVAISKRNALIISMMLEHGLRPEAVLDRALEFAREDMKNGGNILQFSVDQNISQLMLFDYEEIVSHLLKKLYRLGIIR